MAHDDRTTSDLVDELVRDLAPVRRIPSLVGALVVVLVAWGVAAGLAATLHPPVAALVTKLTPDPWFGLAGVGLVVGAVAACIGAIAGVVPGREGAARHAQNAAMIGFGLALGASGSALWLDGGATTTPLGKDMGCLLLGTAIGLAPLFALVAIERRGFLQHAGKSASIALAGAFGLGGLAVQLLCQQAGARHMLFGHVSVPFVMIGLVTLPLAWMLSRTRTV